MESLFDKILALLAIFYALAQTEERFLEILKPLWARWVTDKLPLTLYISMVIALLMAFVGKLPVLSYLGITGIAPMWVEHIMAGALIGGGSGFLNSVIGWIRRLKLGLSL